MTADEIAETISLVQATYSNAFTRRRVLNTEKPLDADCHLFNAFPLHEFSKAFTWAVERAKPIHNTFPHHRFVDAGCGLGATLLFSQMARRYLGYYVVSEGIELDVGLADFANRCTGCRIHNADIRTFDYSTYNIVFWFRPLRTAVAVTSFYQQLLATTSTGTMFIQADDRWPDSLPGVTRVADDIGECTILIRD